MQLKTMMLTLVTIGALTAVADPQVYYVDANRGNDAWTGTADWEHRDETTDPVTGPKQTLQAALGMTVQTTAAGGDVVYAAEGVYDDGAYTNKSGEISRAFVPNGVRLIATGAKENTVILGAADQAVVKEEAPYGCGPDALRCLLTGGKNAFVRGFTLKDGHAPGWTANSGPHCGAVGLGGGLFADCIFEDNVAEVSAAMYGGACFRCVFKNNRSNRGVVNSSTALGCVILSNVSTLDIHQSFASPCMNCTFYGSGSFMRNAPGGNFNNCVVAKSNNGTPTGESLHSLYTAAAMSSVCGETSRVVQEAELDLSENGEIGKDSKAVDFGDKDLYDAFWTSNIAPRDLNGELLESKYLDINGNPRILDGSIDAGAYEYCWYPLDPTSGITLSVSGNEASISRNYTSERLVTGFVFNGESVSFDDYPEGTVIKRTFEGDIREQSLVIVYAEKTEWYVNPVTGDDANKGYGPYCAFKTLTALPRTDGTVSDTNVFHLAAGEYREGVFTNTLHGMDAYYRLYVPAYTRVVCDDARGSAIICGADATAEDKDEDGNGADAVRCVCAKVATGVLVGCTLTGGRSFVNSTSADSSVKAHHRGSAAIVGPLTIVDCVVTNNRCAQTAAVSYAQDGVAIRSYFANNKASTVATDYYFSGKLFDCVFAEGMSGIAHNRTMNATSAEPVAYNCLFIDGGHNATAYNCIMLGSCGSYLKGSNDLVTDRNDASILYGGDRERVITAKQVPYDGDYRPLKTSLAVDAGDLEVYQSALAAAGTVDGGRDFAGGQRVYNGKIDIGPGEYDWRGDFAPILNRKCVAIDAMSAGVTTNETVSSVVLSGGDALTIRITSKADGPCSLRALAASGELTVVANGAAVAPSTGGVFEFNGVAGENAVTVSYVGEATCAVDSVKAAGLGLLLLLR